MSEGSDAGGGELARAYWWDVVAPLLDRHAPGVPVASARLGSGSEVLGYDDAQSRDHDWGLRLTLLVEDGSAAQIDALLERVLPQRWRGLPTRFATTWDPVVRQRCETAAARDFARSRTGLDLHAELSVHDWLSLTGQAVLEVTAGPVFTDPTGKITAIRERLRWYPQDVWLYALAADWSRLEEEMPFVGRTGLLGDDAGSRVIAARLLRTMMHLAHLIHRRWPPYSKWLGRSTTELLAPSDTGAHLLTAWDRLLAASDWEERQDALARSVELLAVLQDHAGLPTIRPATEPFWDRPHRGVREQVRAALREAIADPAVLALPADQGTAEQISDSVRVLVDPASRRRLVEP